MHIYGVWPNVDKKGRSQKSRIIVGGGEHAKQSDSCPKYIKQVAVNGRTGKYFFILNSLCLKFSRIKFCV